MILARPLTLTMTFIYEVKTRILVSDVDPQSQPRFGQGHPHA